jgi:hypothetical protein
MMVLWCLLIGENRLKILYLIVEFLKLLFKSRYNLVCENLLLRGQLAVYQRRKKRPKLENADRLILGGLCRLFGGWKSALLIVTPETVM